MAGDREGFRTVAFGAAIRWQTVVEIGNQHLRYKVLKASSI